MSNKNSHIDYDDVTNVYRTKDFIVVQRMSIKYDAFEGNLFFSADTYYRRTKQRDFEYECEYHEREHIDGNRLHSSAYFRKYIY